MTGQKLGFSQARLRRGAVLGTIAHAVWIARDPTLVAAQAWDGRNYLLNDSSGTLATVTFGEPDLVAFMFDAHSERNPFTTGKPFLMDPYVEGMSSELLSLAKMEALEYMLQDYGGASVALVTAALWSEGEGLVATEPWSDLMDHGGHILRIQLMDDEDALSQWRNEYGLSESELGLVRGLFGRRTAAPDEAISLTDEERGLLDAGAGESEARILLAAIGIHSN